MKFARMIKSSVKWVAALPIMAYMQMADAGSLPTINGGMTEGGESDPLKWFEYLLKEYGTAGLILICALCFMVWLYKLVTIFGSNDKNKWNDFMLVFIVGLVLCTVVVSVSVFVHGFIS